ncbi:regulator of PEP synthase PpsR (kinase-PPPase family) [Pullulanibacillus pueri]|uniref:Putative pyruvate, phosphate dikinase regulatory protein n=1 Tax=Pullulanibacillus pueri TaxID=1437324 RepID=A0A8J2ZXB4_9BACL|nr:pyruvate, water dikinase regulatory protein [Pullulanibacillus pueri]MBM7683035.1 regulator of PEP synthase PpsR (kinase-PPPase family) [Pullulanibacillus pueri]GGH85001.1 putative pyruvate, phosphate dikinase regulatory protein [Pullulanibacillus pueri]
MDKHLIYVVSDSVGETAELVVKAAVSQFQLPTIEIERIPYVNDEKTINEIVAAAKENNAIIAFTLVVPESKDYLIQKAIASDVEYIDIIGPAINKMEKAFQVNPKYKPGLVHKLDEDYFRRVEAIEFAVKYDDGRDPKGILRADIVLIGVSRTSKTPLSQYLALKRFRVANVPIVPEIDPPQELFKVDPHKCFGLRIKPDQLNHIRKERLKALGLNADASYAKLDRIEKELIYFEKIIQRIGCEVIEVSNRAVEETANIVMELLYKSQKR